MNCTRFKNELLDVARQMAKPADELNEHINTCGNCRAYLESQQLLNSPLSVIRNQDATLQQSSDSLQFLLAALQKSSPSGSRTSMFWLKIAAVFLISGLCGGVWIYLSEYRQNPGEKKASVRNEQPETYVPLTYGMAPGESLQRVRVKLPRSALNDLGIAVQRGKDEITADVIVGESGVPYAIRVVQQSN